MDLYGLALFIHILGVITLFGAFVLIQRVGTQLRGADSVEQVKALAKLLQQTGPMFTSSTIFLLVTGLYMAYDVWTFTTSWVVMGLVGLVVIVGLGSTIARTRLQRIGQLAGAAPGGAVPDEVRSAARDPNLWTVVGLNNTSALALVWLMTNKPDWVASIAIWVVAAGVGAVLGRKQSRRT